MSTSTVVWISVKDRLPEGDRLVLACRPGDHCGVASWHVSHINCAGRPGTRFTHWAEMPEPPREDNLAEASSAWYSQPRAEPKEPLGIYTRELKCHPHTKAGDWVMYDSTDGVYKPLRIIESKESVADQYGLPVESLGVCPDCRGSGVYRGLLEEKPCPTCQKGI